MPDNTSTTLIDFFLNNEYLKNNVKYSTQSFNSNKKILQKGEIYPYFCLLIKGTVRVVLSDSEAKHLKPIISDIHENEIFGAMGAFENTTANADIITITPAEILKIDTKSFFAFVEAQPKLANKLFIEYIKTLFDRINRLNSRVISLLKYGIDMKK